VFGKFWSKMVTETCFVVYWVMYLDQAGCRPGRSTCEQVLALSTFIENGFQQKLKTGAVFVDLTAAFDTVGQAGCW